MNRKNVSIVMGILSFILMICGFVGYLYHMDVCGLKEKCGKVKNGCCMWKPHCCNKEDV